MENLNRSVGNKIDLKGKAILINSEYFSGIAIRPKNRRIPDSTADFLHGGFGFQF